MLNLLDSCQPCQRSGLSFWLPSSGFKLAETQLLGVSRECTSGSELWVCSCLSNTHGYTQKGSERTFCLELKGSKALHRILPLFSCFPHPCIHMHDWGEVPHPRDHCREPMKYFHRSLQLESAAVGSTPCAEKGIPSWASWALCRSFPCFCSCFHWPQMVRIWVLALAELPLCARDGQKGWLLIPRF